MFRREFKSNSQIYENENFNQLLDIQNYKREDFEHILGSSYYLDHQAKQKKKVLLHKNIDSKKCSYQLSHDADWVKNYRR